MAPRVSPMACEGCRRARPPPRMQGGPRDSRSSPYRTSLLPAELEAAWEPGSSVGTQLDRGWGWGPPRTTFHWFLSSHPGPDQATCVRLSRLWLCAAFMTPPRLECPPRASPTASSALPY